MRIALCVEYQGSAYRGWQVQVNTEETVQFYLERAVSKVADYPVKLFCAGRTDAGVHATYQIVHFETTVERPLRAWHLGINTQLPRDIRVQWAQIVSDAFQARYDAYARTYHYLLNDQPVASAIARDCG
jgi:tRNA pseudouridine38-40 synthase